MIYSRFGQPVTFVRMGTLDDVKKLEKRRPDKHDRKNVEAGGYVVIKHEDGEEQLAHLAFLRADDGIKEMAAAIAELPDVKAQAAAASPQ